MDNSLEWTLMIGYKDKERRILLYYLHYIYNLFTLSESIITDTIYSIPYAAAMFSSGLY